MNRLEKKNLHRRGAETLRKTIIYLDAPAAHPNKKPLRLCASAVKKF
jgi:hypothetical protein